MSEQTLVRPPDDDVTTGYRQNSEPGDRRGDQAIRRQELAGFLRSRRERIAPEQVGLPPAARRRTPGLRREEVATLAGVGVTWYTWLEQGRDINASPQVLDAVARTLLLDPHERDHLFRLADVPDGSSLAECKALPPTAQTLLDQLEPFPAVVRNARYDMLAWNPAFDQLMGPLARPALRGTQLAVADVHQRRVPRRDPRLGGGHPPHGGRVPRGHGRARRRAGLEVPGLPADQGVAGVRRAVGAARGGRARRTSPSGTCTRRSACSG